MLNSLKFNIITGFLQDIEQSLYERISELAI
jgi:hypothetical protein